jgi:hypothetical protein
MAQQNQEGRNHSPASGSGVSKSQSDLLCRVNYFISTHSPCPPISLPGRTDEDGPDGERQTLLVDIGLVLVIEHTVKLGNVPVLITNDWEFKVTTSEVIDILDPSVVGVDVVGG